MKNRQSVIVSTDKFGLDGARIYRHNGSRYVHFGAFWRDVTSMDQCHGQLGLFGHSKFSPVFKFVMTCKRALPIT